MAKIRKNKRRKKYQFNRNRKRMNKNKTKAPNPSVACSIIKTWNKKKSTKKNLSSIGLAFDVNDVLPVLSKEEKKAPRKESDVVKELEANIRAPRVKEFRIPKNQVEFLTYMLDKYGEDFKAMTRDKRNVLQLTWKQFRAKIKIFKGIPEQFIPYLEKRQGLPSQDELMTVDGGSE